MINGRRISIGSISGITYISANFHFTAEAETSSSFRFKQGHSVNVSKNKMAYEVILAYYLHMPLLLAFFSYFLT